MIEEKQAPAGYLAGEAQERPGFPGQRPGQPRGPARRRHPGSAAELDLLLALYTREEALADLEQLTGGAAMNITELSVRRPTAIIMGMAPHPRAWGSSGT